MPNILRQFLSASDRSDWTVRYLAKKLRVDLAPPNGPPPPELAPPAPTPVEPTPVEPTPTEPPPREPSPAAPSPAEPLQAPPAVAACDLVVSRGSADGYWITHRSDLAVGGALREVGHFQEHAIDDCLAVLKALGKAQRMGTFVDIGANVGTHSIHAARSGFERVLALEPNPTNFMLLRANIVLNGLEDTILCRNLGVSREDTTMTMELSPNNFGDHRLLTGSATDARHAEDGWASREVAVRTFDSILRAEGIAPDALSLVWIDTQGHEGHVLAGARTLREAGTPVVVEFWPYGLERSGGFALLQEALSHYAHVIDLGASEPDAIVERSPEDLDRMFGEFLAAESAGNSPHTDLLLVQ